VLRCLAALVLSTGVGRADPARGDGPSLPSSIAFGTTCARCHEGQCSGRLSFDRGAEAASAHIRRYAGELSPAQVAELFTLLERMKTECAYPPVDAPVPPDGVWPPELLARLCLPEHRACLVPLGTLAPGMHRIRVEFVGTPHVHAQVVAADFETLLEEPLAVANGAAEVAFGLDEPSAAFLRLQAQETLRLERMTATSARPRGAKTGADTD
jgi:hypothetical protein